MPRRRADRRRPDRRVETAFRDGPGQLLPAVGFFPDPADPQYMVQAFGSSVRWSTASVIIAFPVFLFVARHLSRELVRNPVKRLSAVRRWLTYLTLFLAAVVLVGDMITLVYNVLGGELTVRFELKVLVAAAIAGSIYGWYLVDLRREEREA